MAAVTSAVVAAAATAASVGMSLANAGGPNLPKAPNYTKQIVKGVRAESMVLPEKIRSELAARQQFDLPALAQNVEYMRQSNDAIQQQSLDAAEAFAPARIESNKRLVDLADPNRLATRDAIGVSVLEELRKGREMTQEQEVALKDAIRSRQVAMGITSGAMPDLQEGLAISQYKDSLRQQRLSDAGSFLALPSLAEMSSGLPTGYTPMAPGDSFRLFDPRAGQSAADNSSRNFSTQVGGAQPNQFMQGLGTLAGAATRYAGWAASRPPAVQQGTSGATNSWINLG